METPGQPACGPGSPPASGRVWRRVARRYGVLLAILALALGLRLYHVDAPPIGMHSWRQADTAAMARNYFEQRTGFAFPKIDWGRPGPGYVESEFPAYPFVAAIGHRLAGGVTEIIPRLLAVFGSLVGLVFLHRLVAEEIDGRTANWAAFFFAVLPLNVYYGRAIMPEAWMLGSGIAGVYFFARWSRAGSDRDLLLSCALITLSCLLKLPMLHLGLPLLYLAWRRHGAGLFAKARLWLYGTTVLAGVGMWYLHAWWIRKTYKLSFGIGGSRKWGEYDSLLTETFYRTVFVEYLALGHLALFGAAILLFGLLLPAPPGGKAGDAESSHWSKGSTEESGSPTARPLRALRGLGVPAFQRRGVLLFDAWLAAVLIYILIAPRGHYIHEYYQIPLIPAACVYMSRAFMVGPRLGGWVRPVLFVFLAGMLLAGAWTYRGYMAMEDAAASARVRLGRLVQEHTEPGDLVIAANTDGSWDPVLLYLSGRKGWADSPRFMAPHQLAFRVEKGARWLIGLHDEHHRPQDRAWLESARERYPAAFDDGEVVILRLGP